MRHNSQRFVSHGYDFQLMERRQLLAFGQDLRYVLPE